jgi:hypothetical protein
VNAVVPIVSDVLDARTSNAMRLSALEGHYEALCDAGARVFAEPMTADATAMAGVVIAELLPLILAGNLPISEVVDVISYNLIQRGVAYQAAEIFVRRAIACRLSPTLLGAVEILRPAECAVGDPRPYVVKGLLAERDVACIFGPPGAGKSLIGPALCYAVSQGRPFFGHRTRQCGALYVAAEDAHGMQKRVRALFQRHGDAPEFGLVGGVTDLLTENGPEMDALMQTVRLMRPGVVVIDTVAMAFPGLEENDASAMGRVVNVARTLTETGAAVILIHHDTKGGSGTPRGHSILNGALDMAMLLAARDEHGIIRGKLTKNRNGGIDADIAFRIEIEGFGADCDGDPITAAVMAELDPIDAARSGPKLSPGAKAIVRMVGAMAVTDPKVDEAELRIRCDDERAVSAADNAASRERAFRRAFKDSLDNGALSTGGGKVWLNSAVFGADDPASGQADKGGQQADMSGLIAPATPRGRRTDKDNTLRVVRCPPSAASPDQDGSEFLETDLQTAQRGKHDERSASHTYGRSGRYGDGSGSGVRAGR